MSHVIPVYAPSTSDQELTNLAQAFANNDLIHGPFVNKFEQQIASYVNCRYGIGVNSGTSALHIALLVSGIKRNDEVLLTTMTFVASANAITYIGAHPIFIDVEPTYWQMDPCCIERFIEHQCRFDGIYLYNHSTGRPITAIVAVHLLGIPLDFDKIDNIAKRYNLKIIEDAAQSLGATYKGRKVGGIGSIGCFSFHGNKLITAGGGGMIVTNDQQMAVKARYLINQAKDDPIQTIHNEIGYNYRMTNIHGAIGSAQFERIEQHIEAKRTIAARYAIGFKNVPGVHMLAEEAEMFNTFWLTTILLDPEKYGMSARELLSLLRKENIETITLYQPLHLSKAHAGASYCDGNIAQYLYENVLCLPSSVGLRPEDQDKVITTISKLSLR